ncbi:gamma-glutamyltransferase family protein [Thermoactinomyces daqus]|uniref:Gamma-glutamyltransferase family protein n=1 Tax=Thermoactinomyces daqus TaxID=1329516 RepID=A0A7W1X7I6_9BACL|nr:gamma-glutamyltransferase family protein [Thermoactinomyces daqus]MBA4541481.1 gamma-glutamyltransferase family protein [Thermoactinomyces daqus]
MNYDSLHHPYPSRRSTVYAKNGMVATSQPLAAQAGLSILRQGGNAVDAAIATAATLTVVEPTSNGIGGDAFALVWTKGKLHGLNASGPAPQLLSGERLKKAGIKEIPKYGFIPVTVPGAPAAWAELSARFGKLPFAEVLRPAIDYAETGYPLSPVLQSYWSRAFQTYKKQLRGEEFAAWFDTFASEGRAPEVGEIWRSADHAKTLQSIAESKAESFYRGDLAEKIDLFSRQYGGYLRAEDLAAYKPEWVEPIHVRYRGYEVWEIPPNGQGLVTLIALNILKGFDFAERDTVDTFHKQIEALKLAFADGKKYIADPRHMRVKLEELLSDAYAEERRRLIGREALLPEAGKPPRGGTVYLCTADGEGNMVSFIQSNYMGFGSGLVVPGTGIALHNRGHNFTLDETHANWLQPGKKPYHTIIPGFLTKGNKPVGPFGVMGGFMQPQGHLQVIMNSIDFGLNPQAALDAPRWQWIDGKTVEVEHSTPAHLVEALARRGHDVRWSLGSGSFGRGQIIWRQENGVLAGGTEPRTDGQIAAW